MALLVCLSLIGVVAAQVWSNSLTWSMTAEDPSFELIWKDAPPTNIIIGSEFQISIDVNRSPFQGSYTGVFRWSIDEIPIGADVSHLIMDGQTFNETTMELETPFYMADGVTFLNYSFNMTITYVGVWDLSVFLTGQV